MSNYKKGFLFLLVLLIIFTSFVGFNKVEAVDLIITASTPTTVASGTSVTFTKSLAGSWYHWKVNGVERLSGQMATTYTYYPANGDIITLVTDTYPGPVVRTSNAITMTVTTTPCPGIPTVSHGGQTYNTVLIGTQCWLKENLNIGTIIDGPLQQANNNIIEKYCYNNSEASCTELGGLYQWAEAVQYKNGATNTTNWSPIPTTPVQGICPAGWHIPSSTEWGTLMTFLGGQSVAGGKIKTAGFSKFISPNFGATNSSGFTALAAGARWSAGSFYNKGTYTNYWTTTGGYDNGVTSMRYGGASYATSGATSGENYKNVGASIRCVKSEDNTLIADVWITASANPSTPGSSVTFTATPTNGGTTPTYQWNKNGTNIAGATNSTYTYVPQNNDVVKVIMNSSVAGAIGSPATSNVITVSTSTATVPAQVTGLVSTSNLNAKVSLNWNIPANGGSLITDYIIEYKPTSGNVWTAFPHTVTTTPSISVTGLTNGTSYSFRVKAVNLIGAGPASAVVNVTPVLTSVPGQVTGLTATAGSTKVDLAWTIPSDGGNPITNYMIEYKPTSGSTWNFYFHWPSTTPSISVTGLTNGTSYDFKVTAVNPNGIGQRSAVVTKTPTNINLTASVSISASANPVAAGTSVTFTATPTNGGSTPTYQWKKNGFNVAGATSATWNYIPENEDDVSVIMTSNLPGVTGSPAVSNEITITVTAVASAPSAPTNLVANFNTSSSADLTWGTPANTGNSPITNYKIEYKQLSATDWTTINSTTTSKTISGLLGGSKYEYKVSAVNGAGISPSISVTAPGKVIGLVATPEGKGKVKLTWTTPANGGSPITHYRIRYKATDVPPASNSWGTLLMLNDPNATSTYVEGLTIGKTYEFKIRAWGSSAGDWSDFASAVITSFPSSNLVGSAISTNIISGNNIKTAQKVATINTFNLSLSYGKKDLEVKKLQAFLNNSGYAISSTGIGSIGSETEYFGKATKTALIRFQKDKNINPASGNFGPLTRTLVNQIIEGNR